MNSRPDFRIGRIIMLALVTGATAFGLSGDFLKTLVAGLAGFSLALAGFYLDHLLDAPHDRQADNNANPLARGLLSAPVVFFIIVAGLIASTLLAIVFQPWSLVPAALVLLIVVTLSVRSLGTPLLRAVGLGLLQALYALMGGLFAGGNWLQVLFPAGFLFFAMTGGRVLGDVRDLPLDEQTNALTIPRRYGLVFSRVFLLANEAIAYGVGIAAFFISGFSIYFLLIMVLIALLGSAINIYFCVLPTPRRAKKANAFSLGLLGMLYVTAMVVEGILRIAS
jgi:4-hydroxybenzoate polyprenyltransferase